MSNENSNCGKYLVHYLRTFDRVPFGCIVATSPENIGISVCMKVDHHRFTKKEARNRALESALNDINPMTHVPIYRKVFGFYGKLDKRTLSSNPISVYDYTKDAVEYVRRRAKKFFKENEDKNQEKVS